MLFSHARSPTEVALDFVAACNARDSAALANIVADDIVFVDSRGGRIEGREAMLEALAGVNSVAPDLRVVIDRASNLGDNALLTGRSLTENPKLACDTQWRAVVRKGQLVEWQAYGRASQGSLVGLLQALVKAS